MAHAPQLSPHRFSLEDAAAIQASLRRDGYAVVASAATQAELEQARALLWQHLEAQHSWQRDQPRTWTDEAFEQPDIGPPRGSSSRRHGLGGNPRSGLLGSTVHSDCFWYCRTLPGVLRAFEIAYRTDDLVTAFDNMAINRPITCEQPALANMTTGRGEGVGHRWDASLHTHHNQDEFGDEVFICYAILPLWDMNEQTGATAIAPGSHTPGNVAAINEWRANNQEALADTSDPDRHLKPFWALGIQPGPIQVRAGDLCIFDTALFHSACPATDPYGDELLRAICIMSMAPRLLLSPTILRARRLAFEAALGTGGSVLGRVGAAEQMLLQHEESPAEFCATHPARPKMRRWASSPAAIRRIVDGDGNLDFAGAPPQSRVHLTRAAMMAEAIIDTREYRAQLERKFAAVPAAQRRQRIEQLLERATRHADAFRTYHARHSQAAAAVPRL